MCQHSAWHIVDDESSLICFRQMLHPSLPSEALQLHLPLNEISSSSITFSLLSPWPSSLTISFFLIYIFIYLFIFYFWLHWVFAAAHRLSVVVASGGYSLLWCAGFSLRWLLLLRSTDSRHARFRSCGAWAHQLWLVGSRAQAQQLWHTGLVVLRHVGSSWTRAQTCVPCIGRRILNHCTTREVLVSLFLKSHQHRGLNQFDHMFSQLLPSYWTLGYFHLLVRYSVDQTPR